MVVAVVPANQIIFCTAGHSQMANEMVLIIGVMYRYVSMYVWSSHIADYGSTG